MKRLLKQIAKIRARHKHHWKNAVWAWANKGKGTWRRKLRRFRAYRKYATQHENWLVKNMEPGQERKERRAELDAVIKASKKKIAALKHAHKEHPDVDPSPQNGFQTVDGKPVCGWMVPWIQKIRAAGWGGSIVSGVRTPAQSIALCYGICGAPSCPGRCAGATSNHNATTCIFPQGALYVSDYVMFGYYARKVGAPLTNHLPVDPVHYSNSGY